MTITYKMAESFTNIDNINIPDKYINKYINPNLLNHSVKITDENIHKEVQNILCGNQSTVCSINAIKYIEGAEWTKWENESNENIRELCKKVYDYLTKKNLKVIYYKLNRFRQNIKNTNEIMLDYDFVFHKKGIHAYHVNIICVIHMITKRINMVHVNLVGAISEDKIHMKNLNEDNLVSFNKKGITNILDVSYEEDTPDCVNKYDEQVYNILYNKISNNDNNDDDDYKKNVEYTKNQNIVRKMFMDGLKDTNNVKIKGCYKSYPYSNDFVVKNICTNS